MYRKIIIALVFTVVAKTSSAQFVKLNNGILFSSFNSNLSVLGDKVSSHSISLGADYLNNRWFYLSTEVGYMKLGGQESNPNIQEFAHIIEKKNYIHLNTTFRIYKELSRLRVFIGLGPHINILTGSEKFTTPMYHDYYNLKSYGGAKGEMGVTHDFSNFRIGIVGSYMKSVTEAGSSSAMTLSNNSFEGKLSIGYLLNQKK